MFHFPGRDCCIKRQSKLMCNVRSMKRIFCGSTPTSEYTKVSNKGLKNQNTRMAQSESGHVASKDSKTRSDACSGQQSAVPLAVVEEILLNLPAHQVVQVCRLVCHEWKELVDSAAHWRVRCRREGLQPNDASRPPEDWCQFYFLSKFRRNLLKNPRADDGLQGWEIVQNGADNWATELNRIPLPDNTVTKCFVTSNSQCFKEQLIDLKKEGYSEAFMDQLRPHIKISDWYTPLSDYGSQYQLSVDLLDQEKNPIRTYHPYKIFFQSGNDYPWCQISYVFRNYGPGVRFIRFTHGGGWSGIRITNSSVEICPAAERLRCTKPNLLRNPSAQDGLRGWKIVGSGRDCWVIGENRKPIPDSVTSCFITSYGLCLKRQLIDLNKEGYSDTFMDQVQPHIKISDWYASCHDCGSEYQICVELLDQRKNSIKTFQPEKVILSFWNGEPWCEMSHVFKNYGPGVRFIRFTHGGNDTQFWAGHYGIRVTNSSVVIYPADESFRLTNRNLLKNPSAQEGLQGWEIVEDGGDCWVTGGNGTTFPVNTCFVTSYGLCLKEQTIDLKEEGYSDALMDQQQPHIKISDWYAPLSDCGSEYQICVELLDEKKKPISTFQPEKVFFQQGTIYPWRQMFHVFRNYGPGVRFIRFTHGGKDTKFQEGQHGIKVTNSSVEIYLTD
ncbi:uncharacterized protein fbxo44.9 isoform X5 [Carassius gibelio]|uniref:uncharacterized protein fbxo44.9 isoform X5 n=1 Tax=Carassius gibelio TaxID=101364 RepID=UPI002278DE24|nr:uncharacterized protein fbxo44.9 isoform X5 [Carassius gibelio]XP_052416190.1 uncharacterized protein fbxo44.9 isoform X6 [Carassius gibelio]XP_052416191.1 uncharacterized protein fbxo44.9 isoform X5 [Carassius gibelio]